MRLALSNEALNTTGTPTPLGDVRERDGGIDGVLRAFDHARTKDEGERMTRAEGYGARRNGRHRLHLIASSAPAVT